MSIKLETNHSQFILAGNSTFTVLNTETGKRFTYKVSKPETTTPHFVKVLTGADNESDYTFLGTIFSGKTYKHGQRSHITPDAQSAKVFAWAWAKISAGTLPAQIEVHHEGRCGRCGRKLTVPTSITSGFGPECIQYV